MERSAARKTGGFNLSRLDTVAACNKPAEIEIRHPTSGAGTGVYFSVLGKDSDTYRSHVRALADQAMRSKARVETIDTLEKHNIDALVAATVGWRTGNEPVVWLRDDCLDFTAANVRRVYETLIPVREQVAEAINTLAIFMRAAND